MRFIYTLLIVLIFPNLAYALEVINICIPQNNFPFAFMDTDNKLKGFDIDILEKMQLPYKINLKENQLANSFAALGSGECQMILSNVEINESRAQRFLFAKPHLNAGLYAAVLADSPIEDVESLKYGIIGVVKGTSAEKFAFKHYKGSVIYALREQQNLIKMLSEGTIEAIVESLPSLQLLIKEHHHIKILDESISEEYYAYVFSKSQQNLQNHVSNTIDKLKKDGQIDEIYIKWFGNKAKVN